ncbi:hypothetical protein SAY86_021355 [Trapa natans]|uniref:Plastocyanin-like domain-containing protein n=1 Tax=Trapa natans TaxID=22666 RepID=A0AAN7RLJ5_TRANT|nr:hypothetical protein SAY86_021355 [Trapa natans]
MTKNSSGVFTEDFSGNPPTFYNYTASPTAGLATTNGTKVYKQDIDIIVPENHPIHLHGFNFFVVGWGIENYDAKNDPKRFNPVVAVGKNTVGVPSGGWRGIGYVIYKYYIINFI